MLAILFMYYGRRTLFFFFFAFVVFPVNVGSIYHDIRLHVARSYTSSADSPFSAIPSRTLSNHFLVGVPLISSYAHATSTLVPGLSLWFPPLLLSLLFVHLWSCTASRLRTSIVAFSFLRRPISFPVPFSMPISLLCTPVPVPTTVLYTFPLIFTFDTL